MIKKDTIDCDWKNGDSYSLPLSIQFKYFRQSRSSFHFLSAVIWVPNFEIQDGQICWNCRKRQVQNSKSLTQGKSKSSSINNAMTRFVAFAILYVFLSKLRNCLSFFHRHFFWSFELRVPGRRKLSRKKNRRREQLKKHPNSFCYQWLEIHRNVMIATWKPEME